MYSRYVREKNIGGRSTNIAGKRTKSEMVRTEKQDVRERINVQKKKNKMLNHIRPQLIIICNPGINESSQDTQVTSALIRKIRVRPVF